MRRTLLPFVMIGLGLAAACAPRTVTVPAPGAARHPDFVFPAVPDGMGTPATQERHKAGWLWLQAGDGRAAERNFTSALKLTPDFYPAEAGLGYVALSRKDHKQAALHFDRAIVANPRYVSALVGRGEALLALGQREMALKSFEAAVAADANLGALRSRIDVLRLRGMQEDLAAARKAAEGGRYAEARTAYEQALTASPQSPFLYRELAAVERRAGDFAAALQSAKKAAELEPTDVRGLVLIGEIYEDQAELARAAETYDEALAMEPNDALEKRIEELRERLLLAEMPVEFKAIDSSPTVTRAQMAALFGVRLGDLLKRSPRRNAVVLTDTRGSWASPWIQLVTRAGVMEAFPNHTFQPGALMRRADLAQATSRVLALIAVEKPGLGTAWRSARHRFPDVSPGHLSYPAASLSVEAGVMNPLDDGSFQLTRPVTGAEAVAAVRKLEDLADR